MDILRRYAEYLDHAPEKVSELFAEDGYWYDGGMKLFGREDCAFFGRAQIHANFVRPGRPRTPVGGVLINGNAMRYNVKAGDQWVEALALAQLNAEGLFQSFVIACIDFRQ